MSSLRTGILIALAWLAGWTVLLMGIGLGWLP